MDERALVMCPSRGSGFIAHERSHLQRHPENEGMLRKETLRRLLRIPPPRITADQALSIAQQECARLGWPWEEPVDVWENLRSYSVRAGVIGEHIYMLIDNQDGSVRHGPPLR